VRRISTKKPNKNWKKMQRKMKRALKNLIKFKDPNASLWANLQITESSINCRTNTNTTTSSLQQPTNFVPNAVYYNQPYFMSSLPVFNIDLTFNNSGSNMFKNPVFPNNVIYLSVTDNGFVPLEHNQNNPYSPGSSSDGTPWLVKNTQHCYCERSEKLIGFVFEFFKDHVYR
jgi:hypothetical protein